MHFRRTVHLVLAVLILLSLLANAGLAQDSAGGPAAQKVRITATPSGMQRNVPGRWMMLSANGSNRTDQDTEQSVTVWLGEDTNTQYARELWMPAQSLRQTWLPVRIPDEVSESGNHVQMSVARISDSKKGESFQKNVVAKRSVNGHC